MKNMKRNKSMYIRKVIFTLSQIATFLEYALDSDLRMCESTTLNKVDALIIHIKAFDVHLV